MRVIVLAFLFLCAPAFAGKHHGSYQGNQQDFGSNRGGNYKFGRSGEFGYYTLEMSYQIDFCASHRDKPECAGTLKDPMGLHGLWPDHENDPRYSYSFCDTNRDPLDKRDWCAAGADVRGEMQSEVYQALAAVMPGANGSCLYNHEWHKHGTCSGLGVDGYFKASAAVAAKFLAFSHFNDFLRASAGQVVTEAQLADALRADMGDDGMGSVKFLCRKQRNEPRFSAVDINLDRDHHGEFPAHASFAPLNQGPSSNDCPTTGIMITAPGEN